MNYRTRVYFTQFSHFWNFFIFCVCVLFHWCKLLLYTFKELLLNLERSV